MSIKSQMLLFCFGVCLYLLTTGASIDNPDGQSAYLTTRNIVLHHSLAIQPSEQQGAMFEKPGPSGVIYSKYGPAQPLLQVPLFLIGQAIGADGEQHSTQAAVALLHVFTTAATLPLISMIAWIIFQSRPVALALALIYGTATMAWLYATLTYTEPLLTLVLLLVVLLLLRVERQYTRHPLIACIVAGTLAGGLPLIKYPAVVYLPVLLWYTWQASRSYAAAQPVESRERKKTWLAFAGFLAPILVGGLTVAGYNYFRYGDVLDTGYHIMELIRFPRPPWYGFYTLFFSLGKSIFIYAPPLLVALVAFPRFVRQAPTFGRFMLLLAGCSIVFYAVVRPWSGAWSPGPRYQLPILPLLLLPFGGVLTRWSLQKAWKRRTIIGSITVGIIGQIVMVSISYSDTLTLLQRVTGGKYAWGFWFFDPDYMPLLWQGRLFLSALARSTGGSTSEASFSQVASVAHPGQPVDVLNFWFARCSCPHWWGAGVAGGLFLLVFGLFLVQTRDMLKERRERQ
jgi:hypothetical protein